MKILTSSVNNLTPPTLDLLDDKAAADFLQISRKTLPVWRSTARYGIPYIKIGRNVRYRRSDLEAWLVSRTHTA